MAEINLPYLKGVRTRYFNFLDTELTTGNTLLETKTEFLTAEECKHLEHAVNKCKLKISSYSDKLTNQSEKLAYVIGDSDSDYLQTMMDDDSTMLDQAMVMIYELENVQSDLKRKQKAEFSSETSDGAESVVHKMYQIQMKMQQEFFEKQQERNEEQMKMQQKFFEKQHDLKVKSANAVKLPKLDMNSFNGDRLQWTEFWDSFCSAVHKNDKLSPIDKFNYLKGKLIGEAKGAISGLSLSNENYSVAIKILRERFGDKQDNVDLHYKEMLDIQPPSYKVGSLRFFMDTIERHLRSLEVLGENINQHVFVSMIKKKLPVGVLRQLEITKGFEVKWDVDNLRKGLRSYIVACEKSDKRDIEKSDLKGRQLNNGYKEDWKDRQFARQKTYGNQSPLYKPQESAAAFVTNENPGRGATQSKVNSPSCHYCTKSHWSDECPQFRTLKERKQKIKGCCYRCLKKGHVIAECKSNRACVYCNEFNKHHRSLCPTRFKDISLRDEAGVHLVEENQCETKIESTEQENVMVSHGESVFMQTASTEIQKPGTNISVQTRLLLDCGSQRTYITQSLVDKLGLKIQGTEELKVYTFGGSQAKVMKTNVTTLNVKMKSGQFLNVQANIVPVISGNVQRKSLDMSQAGHLAELMNTLDLADTIPKVTESSAIDILIGNDYYLDIVLPQQMEVLPGLYLLSSKLGWILTGRNKIKNSVSSEEERNLLILTYGSKRDTANVFHSVDTPMQSKPDLEDFWKVESIGVKDNDEVLGDEIVMERFKETLIFEDGRYQVTWPWKEEIPDLPCNKELAFGRLKSCLKKLKSRPDLFEKYSAVIQEQLEKGIIENVPANETKTHVQHYIPHHAVIKPSHATTKLRIVYDASARTTRDNKSLNDCLYRGPVLLHDLCGLLMRFRLNKVALVSDIEKAFLQIGLQPSQRDVTRFLWVKNIEDSDINYDNVQIYRFCRVPFGIISSPFLLGATVETHLDSYGTPIAEKLKRDIYVDNIITGANSDQEAIEIYQAGKSMFNDASMNLREWLSNSEYVNNVISSADRADSKNTQVLGHTWDHKRDTLSLKQIKDKNEYLPFTKRTILKRVASVFDPMGLFAPVLLRGKIILQELWMKGLDWDDEIDDVMIKNRWSEINEDLNRISDHKVCRNISSEDEEVKYNLLCFCDASTRSYSTTVYFHQESEKTSKTDLVFAKTRLAPVKELTVPRLELMAVLIGVRCLKFVDEQLQLEISDSFLWTDSTAVLGWINGDKKLPVFVKNRVDEIKKHEHVKIYYVNTKENPADIATRGTTVREISESKLWWNGPTWLNEQPSDWKNECEKARYGSIAPLQDEKKEDTLTLVVKEADVVEAPFGIDIERYSSMTKLLRVTAFVLRFTKKLRKVSCKSENITSEEIQEVEHMWIRYVQQKHYEKDHSALLKQTSSQLQKQLGLYIDDNGLLRCTGRLDNSDLVEGARRPILLPHSERFTKLLIEKTHQECLHSGVSQTLAKTRQKYWITHGRSAVKLTLRLCKLCNRHEGGPYRMPPMPALPKSRVHESRAFSSTGLDYLGPLNIKTSEGPRKVWICLFTCMTTRAIHLELIQDMTSEEFLLGFRRFISQRGLPSEVISDNAAQFKLSKEVLGAVWLKCLKSEDVQSYCATTGIRWNFIVELAPWMGGFYERLVGIVKRALRKSLGRRLLTLVQMQTLIKEVEATVNSRPLVYVEDDLNSNITLCPGHFLTLNPNTGIPESDTLNQDEDYIPCETSKDKLLKIWKKGQKTLDEFWRIWREEYLTSLRERNQTVLKATRVLSKTTPNVGDTVLIKDNVPRGSWKIGKIEELVFSRDGNVRSAKVLLPSQKIIGRPLNLLYPLEFDTSVDVKIPPDTRTYDQCENNEGSKRPVSKRHAANKAKN